MAENCGSDDVTLKEATNMVSVSEWGGAYNGQCCSALPVFGIYFHSPYLLSM